MHALGMTLAASANSFATSAGIGGTEAQQQMNSIEACRMSVTAARVLEIAQRGMLTVERLRNGGRQVVTVQHVTVQDGGKAVVAGALKRGSGQA